MKAVIAAEGDKITLADSTRRAVEVAVRKKRPALNQPVALMVL